MFLLSLTILPLCPLSALGCDSRMLPYGGESAEVVPEAECWDYPDPTSQAKPQTYLEAMRTGLECSATAGPGSYPDMLPQPQPQLCPYAAAGQCHYGSSCPYLHGDMCDICRLQVLHPHDPEQRKAHEKVRVPPTPVKAKHQGKWNNPSDLNQTILSCRSIHFMQFLMCIYIYILYVYIYTHTPYTLKQ